MLQDRIEERESRGIWSRSSSNWLQVKGSWGSKGIFWHYSRDSPSAYCRLEGPQGFMQADLSFCRGRVVRKVCYGVVRGQTFPFFCRSMEDRRVMGILYEGREVVGGEPWVLWLNRGF